MEGSASKGKCGEDLKGFIPDSSLQSWRGSLRSFDSEVVKLVQISGSATGWLNGSLIQ